MWGGFAAYVPMIKHDLGAEDGLFGVLMVFVALGAVTAMWFAPVFAAFFGRYAMAVGAVIYVVAIQAIPFATGPINFALFVLLVGATAGCLDVVMNARLSEIEGQHNRSVMNLNHGVFSLGFGLSALCAGLWREAGNGFSSYLIIIGILVLLTVPMMIQAVVDNDEEAQTQKPVLGPAVLWGGLIVFIGFLCESATEGWSALHIERSLGGSASEGALGPAALGFMMAFGRFGGQGLVSRFSEAPVLLIGAVMAGVGALIAALAVTPLMAYVGFGALGLGVSVVAPMVFALVGRRVPNGHRAAAISRVAVIGYFGFFVGPPLMGGLSEISSLRVSFAVLAVLLLVIPALLYQLRKG